MIHYPYESIRPFLQLLHEAACDPDVVSIKMTLYRLANHSKVVDALVEAAENGKQVDVLVELKARFDEENNIECSRLLERAGCHVVYGIEGLKVHSKLCLITRKTKEGISFITQIGTGNYNEKTSRLYTDLSFLTASKEIGLEATEVFRALDQGETVDSVKNLLVAPHCLQNRLLNRIDGEIKAAARGEGGYIGIKINSLTDKVLINKLTRGKFRRASTSIWWCAASAACVPVSRMRPRISISSASWAAIWSIPASTFSDRESVPGTTSARQTG